MDQQLRHLLSDLLKRHTGGTTELQLLITLDVVLALEDLAATVDRHGRDIVTALERHRQQ